MSSRCRLVVWLVILLFPGIVWAQQPAAQNDDAPETANEKKAFALLNTVATKIPSLRSPDNRIIISCGVAELIWKTDEKRARTLFENVIKEMSDAVAGVDLNDPQLYSTLSWINQLRQDIVGRIARCDPEMALDFLRSTRLETGSPSFNATERTLELYLSRAVAAKNPELAAKIARNSLKQGLTYDYVSLLLDLQRKDPSIAQNLYQAVVDRVKEEDLARNAELANMATNLVNSFQPPQASEPAFRELLETVIKAALSSNPGEPMTASAAQIFQSNLQASIGQVEKYLPGRLPALRQWMQGVRRTMDSSTQMYGEMNEAMQNGTVEDLLSLAQKYPQENRASFYQQAAWKASNLGDQARARQIISEMISDPVQKRQMLDQLEGSLMWKAINENKTAEARAMLSKLGSIDQRIQGLLQIANQLSAKDDKKNAVDCLNEARVLVAGVARNNQKMWMQLQLATAYVELDSEQSFAMVEAIADQLNELVAAAAVMDGFDNNYLKNGEWMVNSPTGLGNVVNNLRRTLSLLGRREFDRAQTLSDRLERPEIRLMAQLDLAQAVLSPETSPRVKRLVRYR